MLLQESQSTTQWPETVGSLYKYIFYSTFGWQLGTSTWIENPIKRYGASMLLLAVVEGIGHDNTIEFF